MIYKDSGGHYRWRPVNSNGQTIGSSGEGFSSHSNAKRAAERQGARRIRADRRGVTALAAELGSQSLSALTQHAQSANSGGRWSRLAFARRIDCASDSSLMMRRAAGLASRASRRWSRHGAKALLRSPRMIIPTRPKTAAVTR